ncbi:hypothetical protein AGLY_008217, partial [Aphis glycines]
MPWLGIRFKKNLNNKPSVSLSFPTIIDYSGSVCVDISTVSVANKWHVHLQLIGEVSKLSVWSGSASMAIVNNDSKRSIFSKRSISLSDNTSSIICIDSVRLGDAELSDDLIPSAYNHNLDLKNILRLAIHYQFYAGVYAFEHYLGQCTKMLVLHITLQINLPEYRTRFSLQYQTGCTDFDNFLSLKSTDLQPEICFIAVTTLLLVPDVILKESYMGFRREH